MSKKTLYISLIALCMLVMGSFSSYAEHLRYVRLETVYDVDTEPKIDSLSLKGQRHYSVSLERTGTGEYRAGDSIPVSVTLTAADGYDFQGIKAASCLVDDRISANTQELSKDTKTLHLSFILPPLRIVLRRPEGLLLTRDGFASWEPVKYASEYKVEILRMTNRGGTESVGNMTSDGTSCELAGYMYGSPGDYLFSVTARSNEPYIQDSPKQVLGTEESVLISEADTGRNDGRWSKDGESYIVGGEPLKGLHKIAGKWYLFGESGEALSGWQQSEGEWLYLDPETDAARLGLNSIEGKTYFFDRDTGIMKTGMVFVGDRVCLFSESGEIRPGFNDYEGSTYYVFPDGSVSTEQLVIKKGDKLRSYMFDSDGKLL